MKNHHAQNKEYLLEFFSDLWYNEAKNGGVVMNNSFIVSYEKLSDEHITSYLIGFHRNDIKDILIQFLK